MLHFPRLGRQEMSVCAESIPLCRVELVKPRHYPDPGTGIAFPPWMMLGLGKFKEHQMSRSQIAYGAVLAACGIASVVQDPINWVGWFSIALGGLAFLWHKVTA